MTKRSGLAALVVAVLLMPVVLTIGAFVLIPLALVLVPVILVFGVVALPTLLVSAVGNTRPHAPAPAPPAAHPGAPIAYLR